MSAQHSGVKLVGFSGGATKLHKRIVSFTLLRLAGTRKITSSLQQVMEIEIGTVFNGFP
jgi:hypothetical protein